MTLKQPLIFIVTTLLFWAFIVYWWHIPDYLLPSPGQVAETFLNRSAVIFHEALPTFYETIFGFVCGVLFGIFVGCLTAFIRPVACWVLPMMIMSQAIPTFAIAPIIVIWLGFGMASKIVTCVLMIFFPVASAVYDGLKRTPQDWLDLAKTMNATPLRLFWHIRLPAALPSLASGIRIAAVIAPIGAIVGEWVGASHGLGYLMLNANARMQIDLMFAALMLIVTISLSLYFATDYCLKKWIWWTT